MTDVAAARDHLAELAGRPGLTPCVMLAAVVVVAVERDCVGYRLARCRAVWALDRRAHFSGAKALSS